ncbi:MAG: type II toxin-antitoxin system HicB family antitoxin [Leptospiraceae bacterium]|jgi:predicted RNase H-like HicB family nuclease|nr:type II toxin-antitoxin system HicB family antitoxin [Leptospiraceae bacterium]MCZ8344876.1 type II toxin-antitoxin system HicB family antitoxin [Leptospiraceae bacterium]PJE01571.1 MAG: hypothetical protein CK427_10500 [Leptospira sp.]
MNFPIVIHKDKNSDYGVSVPDLPGCYSAGVSFEEALEMSKEAILLHLEGMLDDGNILPIPNSIEIHKKNAEYANGIWALVSVDLSSISGKSRRINITLPERILSQIDEYAKLKGESRSGFLASAALESILAAKTK